MKQFTVKEIQTILKSNGYSFQRQKGSHQIWSNGLKTVSLPVVKLKPIIAQKILKENQLAA